MQQLSKQPRRISIRLWKAFCGFISALLATQWVRDRGLGIGSRTKLGMGVGIVLGLGALINTNNSQPGANAGGTKPRLWPARSAIKAYGF